MHANKNIYTFRRDDSKDYDYERKRVHPYLPFLQKTKQVGSACIFYCRAL